MSAIQQMLLGVAAKDIAPTYKGKTTLVTGPGNVNVPAATTVSGDLILLFTYSHRTVSAPAGYTEVASAAAGAASPADDYYLTLFSKFAVGLDSSTSVVANSSGQTIGALKVVVSGAATLNWKNNVTFGLTTGSTSEVSFYSPSRLIENTLMISAAGPRNTTSTSFTVDSYTNPSGLSVSEVQDGVWNWYTNRLNLVVVQAVCNTSDATDSLFSGTTSAGIISTAPALTVIIKGLPG